MISYTQWQTWMKGQIIEYVNKCEIKNWHLVKFICDEKITKIEIKTAI